MIVAFAIILSATIMMLGLAVSQKYYALRILGLNGFATYCVLLIALIGVMRKDYEFIDIAFIYCFLNLIATVVLIRFVRGRQND